MEITCPRCQSLHEIEPPPSARARGPRSLKFRCSHCGHTFAVNPVEAAPPSNVPPPLAEDTNGEAVHLVQVAGQIWSVPDTAALHRWILEERLDRDALVSKHGLRWVRAGDREDLEVFFSAADALSFQHRNLRTELPQMDEEIVVDAGEAGEDDSLDEMPVSTGPGGYPSSALGTVVMGFEPRDDTQEQTVQNGGLDETIIAYPPTARETSDAMAERTERMAAGRAPHDIRLPAGVSTVSPGIAPAGSAAHGKVTPSGPAPSWSGEPALGGSGPVAGNVSQSFFLDGAPAAPAARRDVFDDPPSTASAAGPNWALWGGLAAIGAVVAVAFVTMRGDPSEHGRAPAVAAAVPTAPAGPAGSDAPGADAPGSDAAVLPSPVLPADAPARPATQGATTQGAATQGAAVAKPVVAAPVPVAAAAPPARAAEASAGAAPVTDRARAVVAKTEPAPAATSSKKLLEQGWKAVEGGDFEKAHGLFDRALQGGSASPDALYGRAYANEKLGDSVSAADDYCRALGGRAISIDTQREIEGGLRRVGRTCP